MDVLKDILKDSNMARNLNLGNCHNRACYWWLLFQEFYLNPEKEKILHLIDDSTDIGNSKSLCVVVCLFDEVPNRVHTPFWKLPQIFSEEQRHGEGVTDKRLHDEMIKSFTESGVPLENILGFGSDACNTMRDSVSGRLRNNELLRDHSAALMLSLTTPACEWGL